jgi:hypothetical protein
MVVARRPVLEFLLKREVKSLNCQDWIPAYAGMTAEASHFLMMKAWSPAFAGIQGYSRSVIPAQAGIQGHTRSVIPAQAGIQGHTST